MKEQFENALTYLKSLEDIEACITGSAMLGYMEGQKQDIDIFCYNQASFTKLLYTLHFNPMFLILDKIEQWKFSDYTQSVYNNSIKKLGLVTIKFTYNLSIPINIIFKEKADNIFSILSTFDMDIISIGYDLKSKKTLDLSEKKEDKVVTWNKWNKSFYSVNIWAVSRILRQFLRVVKYHKRGYNTDDVALKYKEILTNMLEYENIFNSDKVDEKVKSVKDNSKILIQIIDKWLETHLLNDDEEKLIEETIKKL